MARALVFAIWGSTLLIQSSNFDGVMQSAVFIGGNIQLIVAFLMASSADTGGRGSLLR